ncbi:MAG: DUF5675 family protein [Steroidobacteraceae bacterium]
MKLAIVRDYAVRDAALGQLSIEGVFGFAVQTLELPWVPDPAGPGGMPGHSCVPAGTYELALHDSKEHPRSFALVNPALGVYHMELPKGITIGRTCCLLHVANYVRQLLGCIGVGQKRVLIAESWDLENSEDAYRALCSHVPWIEGHAVSISYAAGITP